jgi:protein-tyrosine-phosphatase
MAEAYLKSKKIPDVIVSSSGVAADINRNGAICDYTVRLMAKQNLSQYLSNTWRLTDKKDLESQDFVVFMDDSIHNFCVNTLDGNVPNYETWNIPDIPEASLIKEPRNTHEVDQDAERSFEKIVVGIDRLLTSVIPHTK